MKIAALSKRSSASRRSLALKGVPSSRSPIKEARGEDRNAIRYNFPSEAAS